MSMGNQVIVTAEIFARVCPLPFSLGHSSIENRLTGLRKETRARESWR
jgi:hypothetical protein